MDLEEVLHCFQGVKPVNGGYMAQCPAHDDHNPSLSIRRGKYGRIVMKCFAGCENSKILRAVGLSESDLYAYGEGSKESETQYTYRDEKGEQLYRKIRYDYENGKKSFVFIKPDGRKGVNGVRRVPYNLPGILAADKVFFTEGEKCAEAVIQQGYCGTTLDSGAQSKWLPEYGKYFKGKEVIIIPDNDAPGLEYALKIKKAIPDAVIKQLPGIQDKEDIADWLADGHTMDEIDKIAVTEVNKAADNRVNPEIQQCKTQAETLLILMDRMGAKVFRNEVNTPFVAVPVNGHREVLALDSRDFSDWAQGVYYRQTGGTIRNENLKQAIAILSSRAKYDSEMSIPLHVRVANREGVFWYDLSNPAWQAIKVTENGWCLVEQPPILFNRYRHQKPQVMPKQGGDLNLIFQYINIEEYRLLFICWLVFCFVPGVPHPMPLFYGEQGSAKTTTANLLKQLVDPSVLETLTLHNDQRSLLVSLQQHWLLPFDNISYISQECSDMLCRAITGGAVQQRKLCTDADDQIFTFTRCLAINGITNVADRPDLLDRSLLFELHRVPESKRRELRVVYADFERDKPQILGKIFDILSEAMATVASVKLNKLPRMADFTRWGYAIADALGGYGEQFLKEYENNRSIQNAEAIDADVVSTLTVALMKDKNEWTGRTSELLVKLTEIAPENGIAMKSNSLPTHANVLSKRLTRAKSNLESVGISFERQAKATGTYITLHNSNLSPLPPYSIKGREIQGVSNGDNHGDSIGLEELPPFAWPSDKRKNGGPGDNGDVISDDEYPEIEF